MLGCRHGAKNSLDRNYLYLARAQGLELRADTEVTAVMNLGNALDPTTGSSPDADTLRGVPAWVCSRRFPPHFRISDSIGPGIWTARPSGTMPGAQCARHHHPSCPSLSD